MEIDDLQALADEGVTVGKAQGEQWLLGPHRNCQIDATLNRVVGTVGPDRPGGRRDTRGLRIVAEPIEPWGIVTMHPL
jgi:hypothetical protein